METSKTIKPEENAEVSEMLSYVMGQLKPTVVNGT